jgi:hypothetical protein
LLTLRPAARLRQLLPPRRALPMQSDSTLACCSAWVCHLPPRGNDASGARSAAARRLPKVPNDDQQTPSGKRRNACSRRPGANMNWPNKLPGTHRVPPGREWALWKRLPMIALLGTAIPLLMAALAWWLAPLQLSGAEHRQLLLYTYRLAGVVLLHWTLIGTLAIGCVIVMLMKGPAYVADAYPLVESDEPR